MHAVKREEFIHNCIWPSGGGFRFINKAFLQ